LPDVSISFVAFANTEPATAVNWSSPILLQ